MISNKETAAQVEKKMRDCSAMLNSSIQLVMDTSPEEEFREYRRLVGRIMGAIYLDILQPIHRTFPDLEPPELKHRLKGGSETDAPGPGSHF